MNFLKKLLPIFSIGALVFIIALLNYKPGTILTGWDNLHPEFNLLLNIKRSFFAVWQEYQSMGLLGGMGHASDLVRQLFLLLISPFMQLSFMRFFWTILTLFIGGIGALFLSSTLINHSFFGEKKFNRTILPAITGIFYILNLATLQQYYVPFETFTSHFAFLPWMILVSIRFFNKQSRRNAFLLLVTFFLTTPQSYVPTLFVVFTLAATILLASSGVTLIRKRRINTLFKISIKYYALLFIANAFWLLPFAYFTLFNASTTVNAKINQMATPQIILQNKEFGNPIDVMLLKGFLFNNVEPNLAQVSTFMMGPWKQHLNYPIIFVLGIVIFGVILLGLINVIRKRETLPVAFAVLFIFVFTMLCSNTPPFSWIDSLFAHIPLFKEAFRFPFTKFSILAGLLYSLFFTFGIGTIIIVLDTYLRQINVFAAKTAQVIILLLSLSAVLLFMLPVFQGKLFYEKEQLTMPDYYTQVFSFFDKKDPSLRIATLPISNFWSWNYYDWGYGGSGFLWYGIRQPIVDRTFDVWSTNSESSYNELSYALYQKKSQTFLKVLNKYQISYLLVDRSIYSASSPKSLFVGETKELLEKIPEISKVETFGKVDIYHVALSEKPQNFVFTTGILPSSNSYSIGNNDTAYQLLGNYKEAANASNYFVFRNLFSNKQFQKDFSISEGENETTFSKKLPEIKSAILTLPSMSEEKILPIEIQIDQDANGSNITALILLPKVTIGNVTVANPSPISYPLFIIPNANGQFTLNTNGTKEVSFDINKKQVIKSYLLLDNDNYISLQEKGTGQILTQGIAKNYLLSLSALSMRKIELKNISANTMLTVTIPKTIDSYYSYAYKGPDFKNNIKDCNIFRNGKTKVADEKTGLTLSSTNDTLCSSVSAQNLSHAQGYLVHIEAQNQTGSPLHFWVLNENQGNAPIDIDLEKNKNSQYFIVPPMEQYGMSYSFHLDNASTGGDITTNTINSLEVMTLPYSFLTNISVDTQFKSSPNSISSLVSTHPNESLYTVTIKKIIGSSTIILSQSYDPGWKAYELKTENSKLKTILGDTLPFIFGKELKNHVKVNNWENGWILPTTNYQLQTIYIVYLPQYLEYIGFFVLFVTITIIFIYPLIHGSSDNRFDAYFEAKTEEIRKKISQSLSSS